MWSRATLRWSSSSSIRTRARVANSRASSHCLDSARTRLASQYTLARISGGAPEPPLQGQRVAEEVEGPRADPVEPVALRRLRDVPRRPFGLVELLVPD